MRKNFYKNNIGISGDSYSLKYKRLLILKVNCIFLPYVLLSLFIHKTLRNCDGIDETIDWQILRKVIEFDKKLIDCALLSVR